MADHLERVARKRAKKSLTRVAKEIHPGGLHQTLGIPQDRKLTQADIQRAKAMGGKAARQANLAETFAKYRPHKRRSAA